MSYFRTLPILLWNPCTSLMSFCLHLEGDSSCWGKKLHCTHMHLRTHPIPESQSAEEEESLGFQFPLRIQGGKIEELIRECQLVFTNLEKNSSYFPIAWNTLAYLTCTDLELTHYSAVFFHFPSRIPQVTTHLTSWSGTALPEDYHLGIHTGDSPCLSSHPTRKN